MDEYEVKQQICDIGRRIYERKMVAANDGNISVKVGENEFLCTPTGVSKGFMTPESICKIDESGKVLEASEGFRPSSEIKMHLRVYEKRPDIRAVVHAHPVYATTFATMGEPLCRPIMTEAVVSLGCVPVAGYARPSTSDVADAVEEYVEHFDAMLLANHGALTYGETLLDAYHRMESVEFYAELLYRTAQLGIRKVLTPEQVAELYEIRRNLKLPGHHPSDADWTTAENAICSLCGDACIVKQALHVSTK